MRPVELMGLQVETTTGAPIVLLRETDDPHRVLPVFIGRPEALAIAIGLEGATAERPLAHDLLIDVLDGADTRLRRVDVTELSGGTYFAELELTSPDGTRRVPSRPSDAIALAVRLHAPIFASENVLDEAGVTVVETAGEAEVPPAGEIDATVEAFTSGHLPREPDGDGHAGCGEHGADQGRRPRDPAVLGHTRHLLARRNSASTAARSSWCRSMASPPVSRRAARDFPHRPRTGQSSAPVSSDPTRR